MHGDFAGGSALLKIGFALLTTGVFAALVLLATKRLNRRPALVFGLVGALWLSATGLISSTGWLAVFDTIPPRPLPFFVLGLALVLVAGLGPWGRQLSEASWVWLIGLQAFRLPVELLIHRAAVEGIAPPQMTWSGFNLDVITGVTALPMAWLAETKRSKRIGILIWNVVTLGLVLTVVVVGVLSMPTPFQQMKPDNVWIAYFPYSWLPFGLVLSALFLHVLAFRKLAGGRSTSVAAGS